MTSAQQFEVNVQWLRFKARSAVYFYGVFESFIAFILAKVLLMLMPIMVL